MKKEEFEWLKEWLKLVLYGDRKLPGNWNYTIERATKECPPLIDEEPRPDLRVGIGGAHCVSHNADFVLKDGSWFCPKCFPEGFAKIDKQDLNLLVACKTYKENPKSSVCPCCGAVRKRAAP